MRRSLVVMARRPELGGVKTRLAAEIGRGATLALYRRLLARTLRRLGRDRRWRAHVAVTPDEAARRPGAWARGLDVVPQGGGDLGRRMHRAIEAMPPGPVVVVGSDVPGLAARHVNMAFGALTCHDAVFGPAEDGGYWLVGVAPALRGGCPFANVRWSSEHALSDTLAGLPAGARTAMLDMLADIDDLPGLRRWRARPALPTVMPRGS